MPTLPTTPAILTQRARGLLPGTIVELYILDASMLVSIYNGGAGPIFAFHNCDLYGTDALVFQGVVYQPFPCNGTGWESTMQGKLPRPQLTVSNIAAAAYASGILSSILREFNDLRGARLTRKRTLAEFLDGAPTADAIQEFPPEVFFVDHKVSETKVGVQFELAANAEVGDVQLPRRQLTANACTHIYRSGDGCDYAADPRTDQYGNLLGPSYTGTITLNQKTIAATGMFVVGLTGAGGTYNDTTKQYVVSSTATLHVNDWLSLTHASITGGTGAFQIATIVDGTHLTVTNNPLNGLGNKTGIGYVMSNDVGRLVKRVGLPERTHIATVVSANAATLDKAATATVTGLITINRTRDRGLWTGATANYLQWDAVYVEINDILVYYVALQNVPANFYPKFNPAYWVGDVCTKALNGGCRVHFGDAAVLPASLFPALGRTPFE